MVAPWFLTYFRDSHATHTSKYADGKTDIRVKTKPILTAFSPRSLISV